MNIVTPDLFKRFPDPASLAAVDHEEIYPYIKSISYPNNKAKHLAGLGKMIMEDFGGEVPERHEDLIKLPGVGRKTANVIVSVVYQQPAMAVDTHVFRVAARLGLTRGAKTPLAAEKQLVRHIPDEYIHVAHHWLILHGRYVCTARSPQCKKCKIKHFCKYYEKEFGGKAVDKKAGKA